MNAKKVIASAGAFVGIAAGLQGANVTGLLPQETSKRWSATTSLSLFYDDNNLNAHSNPQGSFGVEFYPHLALNLPMERTLFKASYDLRLDYYEARAQNNIDQEHQLDLFMNHRFSERSSLEVDDTFAYSSQPEVTSSTTATTTFQRGDRGDFSHWRNYFRGDYNLRLTPIYGIGMGYRNSSYDYKQGGPGGLSSLLDRTENEAHFEGQVFPSEHERLFLGYQFGFIGYTSSDPLGFIPVTVPGPGGPVTLLEPVPADTRNNFAHYFYVGEQKVFSPRLSGAVSVGARYTDYYNTNTANWSPYFDLSARYSYLQDSTLEIGTKVDRNATDVALGQKGLTQDQLSTIMYINARQRITARFYATLGFKYQHSVYNGGDLDGQADNYFTVNPKLEYMITPAIFVDLAYVHDQLLSNRPDTAFKRNRVSLGLRAVF